MQQVAIVMGFMLTMQWPGLPEIKAPIYTAGEEQICYSDRDEYQRERSLDSMSSVTSYGRPRSRKPPVTTV